MIFSLKIMSQTILKRKIQGVRGVSSRKFWKLISSRKKLFSSRVSFVAKMVNFVESQFRRENGEFGREMNIFFFYLIY